MNWAIIIWLGLLLTFLVVEAVCAVHLVSIWFAVGALLALFAALAGAAIWLQVGIFLVVSCALLAMLWPLVRKFLNPDSPPPMWTLSSALWGWSPRPLTICPQWDRSNWAACTGPPAAPPATPSPQGKPSAWIPLKVSRSLYPLQK